MMKKLLTIVFIVLLVCVSSWPIAGQGAEKGAEQGVTAAQSTNIKMDGKSFLEEFVEAFAAQDQAKMEELVRQAGPHILYTVTMQVATEGIKSTAEVKDGSIYFNTAEAMASAYVTVFKQEGLIELVRKYEGYTPEICREKLRGDNLLNEGIAFYDKEQYKEALGRWDEALKIFRRIGATEGEAKSLNNIGGVYYSLGQYDEALIYFGQSLEIDRMIGDVTGEATSLNNIGEVYRCLGQYAKALEYCQGALAIFRRIGDQAGEAMSLGNIEKVYRCLGQYSKALEYNQQSLQGAEKDAGEGATAQGSEQKINPQSFLYKFVEALKANDQSRMEELVRQAGPHVVYEAIIWVADLGIKETAEGKEGVAHYSIAFIMATAYEKMFKKEGLVELVQKYVGYTPEMCREKLRGDDLLDESESLFQKGQFKDALDRWSEALTIFQRIGDVAREAQSLGNIGLVYGILGQYNEALEYFQQALEIQRKIGDLAREAESLGNAGLVYRSLGQYDKALEYFEEGLEIARIIEDGTTETNALNCIGLAYEGLEQYDKALKYYHKSLEIARRIGDVAGKAYALNNIGIVYRSLGQYAKALEYHQQSLEMARKIGDVAGEAKSLMYIGKVYGYLGQYDKALEYIQQSEEASLIEEFKKAFYANDQARMEELVRQARQNITFSVVIGLAVLGIESLAEGKEVAALTYFETSEFISTGYAKEFKIEGIADLVRRYKRYTPEMCREKLRGDDLLDESESLFQKGQFKDALDRWSEALTIFQRIGDVAREAQSLGNIGLVYGRLGQYSKALEYIQQALEIDRRIGDVAGATRLLGNIGLVYGCLGQHNKALVYLQGSLELARIIEDVTTEANALNNIGDVYYRFGQYDKALEYIQQSLEIKRKISNVAGVASSLGNIGNIYVYLGQYTEGLKYYQQSLEIFHKIGNVVGEAISLGMIGLVYNDLGQYSKAVQQLRESIKIAEQYGALEIVWRGYRGLGIALWKSGKAKEAMGSYEKAIETIEELYTYTTGLKTEERSSMIGEKRFVYKEFIELLLKLHRDHPNKGYDKQAFLIAEKAKSRTFQELMAKAGAKIVFAEEAKDATFKQMIEQEQQLIIKITNLRILLATELSKPEKQINREDVASLIAKRDKAEKELGELEKEIEKRYPHYADLKLPKPLPVEGLQEILKPDETLLAYAVGKEKTAVFVIGKKSFKLIEIGIGENELAELVKSFRKGLDDVHKETWDKDLEQFKPALAYELYRKIFEPVSSELKDVKKLYISADDILYTLPFEALVDKPCDQTAFEKAKKEQKAYFGEFSTLHYLIDNPYTITYLPSASVLRSLRKHEKAAYGKWSKPLIAFADPIFGLEEEAVGKGKHRGGMEGRGMSDETQLTMQIITHSTGGVELKRLKESAKEAAVIAKQVGGKKRDIYLRDKATEENVYQADLKEARYLLFSTHGLLGGDFKGVAEPALVLTLINNPKGKDGFLTMSKVLGLDLNAELIILSACNTCGRGDMVGRGEGFVGLTRSFMYAGTRSILVTHWSVDSQAARVLMVNMFKNMKEESRAKALRDVKLTMKGSTMDLEGLTISLSHPFFWAPFVLVGEEE